MGRFKEAEKRRLAIFKIATDYFTAPAKQDGVYAGRPRPFCLPIENAEENLYSEFRDAALAYFAEEQIGWHQGSRATAGEFPKPNNHLCSSQVCCVNFLFAFADKPAALAALLRPIFPSLQTMVVMERPGQYVSHEWIGQDNYLHEKIGQNGKRTARRALHQRRCCRHVRVHRRNAPDRLDRVEVYRVVQLRGQGGGRFRDQPHGDLQTSV